jgi:tetratricopeptide (TPR) repeat protein
VSDSPDKPSAPAGESDDTPDKPARQELPSWSRSRSKKKKKKGAGADEDAFQRGVKQAGRAALNKSWLVLVGLALAAGGIGIGVYLYRAQVDDAASATRVLAHAAAYENRAMIGDVETIMGSLEREPPNPIVKDEAERNALALEALDGVDELGDKDATLLGNLIRASQALREGDPGAALALYDAFLAGAPADHPMGFVAREGRGIALEASGDLEGALAAYEGIATEAGLFYRDMSLYHRGRMLEALDRKDEAVAVYKQYIEEFPLTEGSLAREEVKDRMLELDPEGLAAMGPQTNPDAGIEIIDP